VGRLAKDSFRRFRAADGFSHSRALAFRITFTLLPVTIAVVGLATILHAAKFRDILRHTVTRLAPGPAGDVVESAFKQGERTVGGGARAALLFGVVATPVSAATAIGQVERGANRVYGAEQDRPTLKKHGVGLLLACTTGLLMVIPARVIDELIGHRSGGRGQLAAAAVGAHYRHTTSAMLDRVIETVETSSHRPGVRARSVPQARAARQASGEGGTADQGPNLRWGSGGRGRD
jgi:uncharacterized BrkB/YihY/UPF0761 family membrane protein